LITKKKKIQVGNFPTSIIASLCFLFPGDRGAEILIHTKKRFALKIILQRARDAEKYIFSSHSR